jgi:hypothetical protein
MAKLDIYEVELSDGVTVRMKLDRERAEKADPARVRRVNEAKRPQNKAATPRAKSQG